MRLVACSLALVVLASCAEPVPPDDPSVGAYPDLADADGSLAETAREYFDAIRDDDAEPIARFLARRYAPDVLSERGIAGWTTLHLDLVTRVGPVVESRVVESRPNRIEVLTRLENGTWLSWTFASARDGVPALRAIRVVPAAPPDLWAPVFAGDDVSALAEELRRRLGRPAVALALARADGRIDAAAVGQRKAGETDPARRSDLFHVGACTRSVTALLVASLVDEGLLSWDDTIAERLGDDFEVHPAYRDVTLAEAARHRAGLAGHVETIAEAIDRFAGLPGTPTEQRAAYLREVLAAPPEAERGSMHESNAGYCLLGHVCERILGAPYEQIVRQRVLERAGIETSTFGWPAGPDRPSGVWGHVPGRDGLKPFDAEKRLGAFLAPAGDLALRVDDLARLALEHVTGPAGSSRIASAGRFTELHSRRPEDPYGAGVRWSDRGDVASWGDTGSTSAYWATFRAWPELGLAAAVAVNGPVDGIGERAVVAAFDALVRAETDRSSN